MELEMKLECEIERNVCLKYICVPKPFKRLFQKVMQKALISWIRVRKFITTDKRKLFYEPSSAKMNSRNFLFFIKEPVFLKLVQKRINVGPNSFIFTMKVCATSHNTLQNTVFRISDSHPVYAVYQGDKGEVH